MKEISRKFSIMKRDFIRNRKLNLHLKCFEQYQYLTLFSSNKQTKTLISRFDVWCKLKKKTNIVSRTDISNFYIRFYIDFYK